VLRQLGQGPLDVGLAGDGALDGFLARPVVVGQEGDPLDDLAAAMAVLVAIR
jgi:hypothetical protein